MTVTGHHYTSTRVRGMAEWNPNAKTEAVLAAVANILDQYREHLPLTARQIFYRLVATVGYDKTEKAYKRLLEYLNRARRANMIPFWMIRDDGFSTREAGGYDSPEQWIEATVADAAAYRRDRQDGQEVEFEVWVEAAGMVPQVARYVQDFGISVSSSGGFNSTTSKHTAASRIADRDRQTVVFHIGDYDPSGVAIIDSLADDIGEFVVDLGGDYDPVFERVAITPEQQRRFGLPGAPRKRTDNRAGFEDETVQAEALTPDQLRDELLAALAVWWDEEAYRELLAVEAMERTRLVEGIERIRDDL